MKGKRKPLDLVSITQSDRHTLSFLSQSLGMIAEVDLGTEHLRWMGDARFTIGLLQRVSKKVVYPCDIAVKIAIGDKESIRDHFRQTDSKRFLHTKSVGEQPVLEFGTVNDPLPDDWKFIHHAELGIFYAGNVSYLCLESPPKLTFISLQPSNN